MNDFCCTYPVEVIVKESSTSPSRVGLMYSIYPDDNGVPCGTCWMPDASFWLTVPLACITPKLDVIKMIQINE